MLTRVYVYFNNNNVFVTLLKEDKLFFLFNERCLRLTMFLIL